jgi:putative ABC transport system permease protein
MRAVAVDTSGRSWIRLAIGAGALLVGLLALASGLGDGGFSMIGLGIFFVFVALVVFGPAAARPTAGILGGPLPRLKGIVGRLAQLNAGRNPKRTAYTASALMIGLGVVSLFLVLNASVRQSIDEIIDERFTGDFVVASEASMMGGGLPSQVEDDINDLSDVDVAAGIRFGFAEVDGNATTISGVDPERAFQLFDVGVSEGNADALNDGGIATTVDKAEEEGWKVGDEIDVTFAETGAQRLPLVALIDDDQLTGSYVVGTQLFEDNIPNSGDALILVKLADGVTVDEARSELDGVVDQFASAELQDLSEYKEANKAQFNQILIMMSVLLTITIIIAMIGIVNTLILSVVERTQEIGLTRAVGASRRQIRSTIRWEALLIAAFGLIAALATGVLFGWVVVEALKDEGFSAFVVPFGALIGVAFFTGALTLLAALFPAAWAARRPILAAIADH